MKYPKIEEFECPLYKCKDCKHFCFVTPKEPNGCTHRFDHAVMEYARPYFVSVPEENGTLCDDFEPNGQYVVAMKYWNGIEHYRKWLLEQDHEDFIEHCHKTEAQWKEYLKNKKAKDYIGFQLKQEPNVRYYVKGEDYRKGKMWDGNKLKAVLRGKYVIRRDEHGITYEWTTEKCDGVVVEYNKK